jgi:NAD(P)-dependent dehydrogenase (short-subunit alcohol dehydrogenase family)
MARERVILIVGADTHLGRFVAETLARDGHAVYACMPDICGVNQALARSLIELAFAQCLDLHVLAFAVPSESNFAPVIDQIRTERGRVDILMDMVQTEQLSAVEMKKFADKMHATILHDTYKWPAHIAICMDESGATWKKISGTFRKS